MQLSKKEIELIEFLYNYRLGCEIVSDNFEIEDIDYMKSINGNYKEMFDFSNCYHNDERLKKSEKEIIKSLYKKIKF